MAFLSQAPPLGGLLPPHGAFQEHAAHPPRWPGELSSKGSSDTCISDGVPHSSIVLSRRTVRTWYVSMPASPLPRLKLASMDVPALRTRASSPRDGSFSSLLATHVG